MKRIIDRLLSIHSNRMKAALLKNIQIKAKYYKKNKKVALTVATKQVVKIELTRIRKEIRKRKKRLWR